MRRDQRASFLSKATIFSGILLVAGLFSAGAGAGDLQTEWNAVAGAADAPPGIDMNPRNYIFEIGAAPAQGRISFWETPGPYNSGRFNQRTTVGHGPFGNGAPLPTACNPAGGVIGNPACDANTEEQCVDAHSFLQRRNNFGTDFRCLAGTALLYAKITHQLEQCGDTCFVDVTSMDRTPTGRQSTTPMIGAAAAVWAVRQRANAGARLYIRVTVGYPGLEWMRTELQLLDPFLNPRNNQITAADLAKMTIRGMALSSGAAGAGNWSHAKLFAVLNASDQTQSIAMLGGQNHWSDYFDVNRPFDSTILLEGAWARAPSYALDGAVRVFRVNQGGNPRYFVYGPPAAPTVGPASTDMGVSAKVVLGNAVNIAIGVANPAQNVIALFDMGAYSRANNDRVIFYGLGAVTKAQAPQNAGNSMFGWVQGFCNLHCGGRYRHPFTFVRSVAEHIVNPAELGTAANKIRLLMGGNSETLSRYAGGNPANVVTAFQNNAAWTACIGTNLIGWSNLQGFATPANHNPGSPALNYAPIRWRRTNCWQSAYRQVALRSQLRLARARNAAGTLVAAGEHHKIYVFDNAAFVGSFNPYPSTLSAGFPSPDQDSVLIENGLWSFDQPTRNAIRSRFNMAWDVAARQYGGTGGDPGCQNVPPQTCIVGSTAPFECCRDGICPGDFGAISNCQ